MKEFLRCPFTEQVIDSALGKFTHILDELQALIEVFRQLVFVYCRMFFDQISPRLVFSHFSLELTDDLVKFFDEDHIGRVEFQKVRAIVDQDAFYACI